MPKRTLPDAKEPPTPRTPSARLLVVEDDPDHRATVREILEEEGYRVETAIHGADAFRLLAEGPPPDLILLDLMMPEMDGWEFMAELERRPELTSIPIVVTSQVGNRLPQSTLTRYVAKPLDRTRLLQTISACLWRRSRGGARAPFARVLVADDDLAFGTTVARLLAWDHDVVAVTGARAALERVGAGERFDAILCDLQTADMTGMELHAKLSQEAPEQAARMVFMVSATLAPAARAFLEQGTARWIEKPFAMTRLLAVLQPLVDARRPSL